MAHLNIAMVLPLGNEDEGIDEIAFVLSEKQQAKERLEKALHLFDGYLPDNTKLTIESTDGHLIAKYIFRLQYTSKNSGRTMCMIAKGDNLPEEHGHLFDFYLRQLVLSPAEIGREFSRIAWLEKRARQDAFLSAGKLDNIRVSEDLNLKDRLNYKDYI